MFGGKDKERERERPPIKKKPAIPNPTTSSRKQPQSQAGQITAYLGPDVHIEGTLRFENSVLIEGTFKGEILSEGNLVIGESAEVDARICTETITIKGLVKGTVEASSRVELKGGGSLQGDVITPSLQMDETVFFQGSCSMPSSQNARAADAPKKPEKKHEVNQILDAVQTVER